MVLLMSVNPGFGGQDFIYQVLGKIRRLKDMLEERELNIPIEVDNNRDRLVGSRGRGGDLGGRFSGVRQTGPEPSCSGNSGGGEERAPEFFKGKK